MTDKIEVPTEERILRCAARLIHEALLREAAQPDNTITIDELVAQLEADPEMKVAIDRERLWARGVRNDLEELRRDAERLDWLDKLNSALNERSGTTYGWSLVLSPNVVRLMSGQGHNGFVADIDLHDSQAHGANSCRTAIDRARDAISAEREGL